MGSPPVVDEAAAKRILARCLERRDHSRSELAAVLKRRGIPDEAAEVALERFAVLGLVDDAEFARRWVASRGVSGARSARVVALELRQRGVGSDEITEALEEYGAEEQAATALRVAQRFAGAARRRGDDPLQAHRKVLQSLARRGFPPSLCAEATAQALGEHSEVLWDDV